MWRAVARVLRSPVDTVSCALLPAQCTLCGSPLPRLSPVPVCDACWSDFPVQSDPVCSRCGEVLGFPDSLSVSSTCRPCRLAPPPFVRAVSYGPYEGRMRDAIHALKYGRLHSAAGRLGEMLAAAIRKLAAEAPGEMLVIPVPLHRSKYAQRGFNQARLLATHALTVLRRTNPGWRLRLASSTVVRLRPTGTQAGLTPHQRRQNVRGAFVVADPKLVTMKHILIIDDILTTGATARSVAQVLLRSGAATVWVATLARAHRAFDYRRSSDAVYSDGDSGRRPQSTLAESAPADQTASLHLSQNQPSF